jgi:hypothetical protein
VHLASVFPSRQSAFVPGIKLPSPSVQIITVPGSLILAPFSPTTPLSSPCRILCLITSLIIRVPTLVSSSEDDTDFMLLSQA